MQVVRNRNSYLLQIQMYKQQYLLSFFVYAPRKQCVYPVVCTYMLLQHMSLPRPNQECYVPPSPITLSSTFVSVWKAKNTNYPNDSSSALFALLRYDWTRRLLLFVAVFVIKMPVSHMLPMYICTYVPLIM